MARTRTKRIGELAARAEKLGYRATMLAFNHFMGGLMGLSDTPAVLCMFSGKEIVRVLERAVALGEKIQTTEAQSHREKKGPVWQN